MTTLTDFLLARIAEDEARVEFVRDFIPEHGDQGEYINPARVLAECAAKRRIVDLADEATGLDLHVDSEFRVGDRDEKVEPYLGDQILRAFASVHADHPDYREEWRP